MARNSYPQVFDWNWSDGFPSESSRAQALKKRPLETCSLAQICESNNLIHFALWSSLPKGHPVGELWMETETDLHGSIYLAYGGYFRQALGILRFWLEMATNGVYFAKYYEQPTSRYRQWRAGGRQAPTNMRQIANSLATRDDKLFEANCEAIQKRIEPIYSILCHHVHGQGLDEYDLQDGRDNVPRFLERSFDLWWESLVNVSSALCYLYRLFYAEAIGAYLSKSGPEMGAALSLIRKLKEHVPEFSLLVTAASGNVC